MSAPNLYDAEGWRYGVRYGDGSVAARWTGRSQRARAEEHLARTREALAPDQFHLVRCRIGGEWEPVS